MKNFYGRLAATGMLVALICASTPVLAQDNTGGGGQAGGGTTAGTDDGRDEGGFNPGWLGLLGLAGLAGLRKPAPQTVVHRDTNARP